VVCISEVASYASRGVVRARIKATSVRNIVTFMTNGEPEAAFRNERTDARPLIPPGNLAYIRASNARYIENTKRERSAGSRMRGAHSRKLRVNSHGNSSRPITDDRIFQHAPARTRIASEFTSFVDPARRRSSLNLSLEVSERVGRGLTANFRPAEFCFDKSPQRARAVRDVRREVVDSLRSCNRLWRSQAPVRSE